MKHTLKRVFVFVMVFAMITSMMSAVTFAKGGGGDNESGYEFILIRVNGVGVHTNRGSDGDHTWLVQGSYDYSLSFDGETNVLTYSVGKQKNLTYTVTPPAEYKDYEIGQIEWNVAYNALESVNGDARFDNAVIDITIKTVIDPGTGEEIEIPTDPTDPTEPEEPKTYPVTVEVYTKIGADSSYSSTPDSTGTLGSEYELNASVALTADEIAGYGPAGYTYDSAAGNVTSGTVSENGLTLKLYFWKDYDKYPVTLEIYTKIGADTEYSSTPDASVTLGEYVAGQPLDVSSNIVSYGPEGYTYDTAAGNIVSGVVSEDGLTLKLYFWKDYDRYPATLEIYTKIGADTEYSATPDSSYTLGTMYLLNEGVELSDEDIAGYLPEGYTYDTAAGNVTSGTVSEDGLTLKLYFWRDYDKYPVIVNVYTKIGADSEYAETPDGTYTLGAYVMKSEITLTDEQIAGYQPEGYTYDTAAANVIGGTVTEEGLVLNLYFWREYDKYPVIVEIYTKEGRRTSYNEIADSVHNLGQYVAGYVYMLTDEQIDGFQPEGYVYDKSASHVLAGEVTEDGLVLKLYFLKWIFPIIPTNPDVPEIPEIPSVPEVPETPVVTTEIEEEDVPMAEEPVEEEPAVDQPDEDVPLADLPDEDVPMADVPKTGDMMSLLMAISGGSVAGLAGLGLALLKKREND